MSRTLYLECNSGISGDMFVAAMLDLGVKKEILERVLETIPVEGYEIKISRVKKSGLDACDFDVILDKEHENHDHDMEYLHGHGEGHHEHPHDHGEEHHHPHEHHHAHSHRGLEEIKHIIAHTDMSDHAKAIANRIFDILADAEAKAHGLPKGEVHFHEVGAVDSIVDIIAAAVCIDEIGAEEIVIPALYEGHGTIRCQHGIIPVPVPATANIAAAHNLPLRPLQAEGEFVTPTGAAIVAAIMTGKKLPEEYTIESIGIGAGKREYERPSLLRAMLLVPEQDTKDRIYQLETNIDDCSGEALGYVMDLLLKAGARDVFYTPIYMKKNRPAYKLSVLCKKEDIAKIEKIIFQETTTIGIRRVEMERTILSREIITFESSLGMAQVKVCQVEQEKRGYPEHDSVVELCKKTGKSYGEVYQIIQKEWNEV